jgi:hypothetical protein
VINTASLTKETAIISSEASPRTVPRKASAISSKSGPIKSKQTSPINSNKGSQIVPSKGTSTAVHSKRSTTVSSKANLIAASKGMSPIVRSKTSPIAVGKCVYLTSNTKKMVDRLKELMRKPYATCNV